MREAAVFYNLGNCEHRQGHPGRAVLNYRRAQHLDPADADIEANLRFVQEQARVEPTPPPGTLRRLLLSAPANVWVCASMIGWWGGLILIAATRWRKARMPAGLLAFFAVLLVAGTTATALYLTPGGRGEAVAMQPAIARFSPLETAEPHFQLAPGAICLLEPRQGVAGWLQVRSGDKTGWVPADRVAKVELE
ncbi:MAG: tetratricopeptide repeat protein [Kiritimatiellia bacterium]